MTTILDLPEDVTRRYIFSRLAPPDLLRCDSTCAAWRSALRADEESTWLASLSLAYDEPEKPPHRLEHAPAPAPVRVAYARRAEEMGGWRALAAARARVERLTSKLILDPDVGDVWHLDEKARLHPDTYVWTTDVWTKARRLFADAESRAWAICAARSSRLGCEDPPRAIAPEETHMGYVDFTRADPPPEDVSARERRRLRRRRYETIVSLVSAEARAGIADALKPPAEDMRVWRPRSTSYQSHVVACVERAAAHLSTLLWDGRVERDFRGDGAPYVGGRDARSAHRVDPDAVAAALDKLGAEFKRRLVSANVDPASDPLRAVEMLMEYFSARMRGEEDFSRARDDAGPVGLDAEARFFFERSPLHAGPIPEDAFAALLDPRVPAPVTGGLRLRKPAMGPGAGYYQMRNSSLASVLNQHEGIPITLCVAFCGIARRGGLSPMFLNVGGHFLCAVTLRAADDGSRTVQVVDPFHGTPPFPQNRFELHHPEMLDGETDVAGGVVARLLRNLTNICVARLRPPRDPTRGLAGDDVHSVAGDPGLVHQTLVTHRALIDAMRGVLEGIGWMGSEGEPGFDFSCVLAREIAQNRDDLEKRARAFEAGAFPPDDSGGGVNT